MVAKNGASMVASGKSQHANDDPSSSLATLRRIRGVGRAVPSGQAGRCPVGSPLLESSEHSSGTGCSPLSDGHRCNLCPVESPRRASGPGSAAGTRSPRGGRARPARVAMDGSRKSVSHTLTHWKREREGERERERERELMKHTPARRC